MGQMRRSCMTMLARRIRSSTWGLEAFKIGGVVSRPNLTLLL